MPAKSWSFFEHMLFSRVRDIVKREYPSEYSQDSPRVVVNFKRSE
jgi:hypothetical protein